MMRFGSVCSGIEAASVAWLPLGWTCAWLSEIDPFANAVLAYHYPNVPNYGDMRELPTRILNGEIEAPDMLCGGTPCQSYSIAGLRKSLDDERGNLTLVFIKVANAIDTVRAREGKEPCIIFWENVPGVLNTKDNAFGCFLAGLAGGDVPFEVPSKWSNAGFISGGKRKIAWRLLDAQYFGVPQRRKRIFVIASSRDGFDPSKVLFECEGLQGDIGASKETGKDITAYAESSFGTFCETGLSGAVRASGGATGGGGETLILNAFNSNMLADTFTETKDKAATVISCGSAVHGGGQTLVVKAHQLGFGMNGAKDVDVCPTVTTRAETYRGGETLISCFRIGSMNSYGMQKGNPTTGIYEAKVAPTIQAGTQTASSAQGGLAICVAENIIGRQSMNGGNHSGWHTDVSYTLNSTGVHGVCRNEGGVRRLTPKECERLQGFPDNYTLIPYRGKAKEDCPDGPRYKALGNSWAVPVVRWIGERIDKHIKGEL